jgi:cysteine desulfurase / selenocysteine lyase
MPPPSVTELREREFPWTRHRTYLNHASIGPIPARTQRAIDAVEAKRRDPGGFDDAELMGILRSARAAAAEFLGAGHEEIALAPNTSYGLNAAAAALPLRAGDVVVLSDGEFPANVYPWLLRQRHGVRVELVPRTPAGWPDEERLLERVQDAAVRVLAVSFVQFASGYRLDLERLGRACRASGTFLVVDAIQGLGQCPLRVDEVPVDLLACGAQKWLLGPWGAGFLYVRSALVPELEPAFAGWMAFRGTDDLSRLTDYDPTFHADARRFEMVTLPFQDLAGMTASLGLLREIGVERVAAHQRALRHVLEAGAGDAVRFVSPADPVHDSGIWCVRTRDVAAAFARLRTAGVVASLREGSIRISPHAYNTADEVARVAELLAAP